MALEGNLEEFNIVAVLQTIASGQMSGVLTIWDAVNKTKVTFIQGLIIHADSTQESDRFGEILVRTHRVTRAQIEKAAAIQLRQSPGQRLGHILLEMHLITSEDLAMAVQIQILEVMSRLLLATRGRWHFQFDPPGAANVPPPGALTIDEILSGQVMLLDSLEPMYNKNEMLDEVYTIVPGRNKESDRIVLEGDEWMVLSAIDGKMTVRETAARLGMDSDQICQTITDLLAVRLLTRVEPGARPAENPMLANLFEDSMESAAPQAPGGPAAPRAVPSPPALPDRTVVVNIDALELIRQVLTVLLARTEGREVCLIDSSGSLIVRVGSATHSNYPMLFALAASIFASWQELGRSLGESKASTLLYQGSGLNICLTPVGTRAILMTLYHHMSNSGLVNYWSREASLRIGRLLDLAVASVGAAGGSPPAPAGTTPPPARNGSGDTGELDDEFQAEAARQLDDLFRA